MDENAPLMFPLAFDLGNSIPRDGWMCWVKEFQSIGEKHWCWNEGNRLFAFDYRRWLHPGIPLVEEFAR